MEQFNLERALAGEALVTRDGREVTDFKEVKSNGIRRRFTYKGAGFPFRVLEDGTHESGNKDLDLFMVKSVTAKVEPATTAAPSPAPYNPQSKNLLQEANDLIYGQRESDYGSVTTNFNNIAQGWSIILGVTVTPTQVGLAMAWLKTCREVNKSQRDNILDIAGYMGCLDKLSRGE